MPYTIKNKNGSYILIGTVNKKVYGTHTSKEKAQSQIKAIEISKAKAKETKKVIKKTTRKNK